MPLTPRSPTPRPDGPLPAACVLIACLLAVTLSAQQPPTVLNTQLRSFTSISTTAVSDCETFTDSLGRDFALLCNGWGMHCWEITNPAAPVFASSIPASGSNLRDARYLANPPTVFAVQQGTETQVVDIADPYNMQVIATIPGGAHNGHVYEGGATPLFLQARAGSGNEFRVFDVSNPATPVQTDQWTPPGGAAAHDLWAHDDIAYVCCWFGSIEATYQIDISDPNNVAPVGPVVPSGSRSHSCTLYEPPGGASKYLITSNEITGGHLKLFDVSDVNAPVACASYMTPLGATITSHNPVVMDKYCFVAWTADYLRIVDLSRPAEPVTVGIHDPDPTNIGSASSLGATGVSPLGPIPGGYRVVLTESGFTIRGFYVIDFLPPETPSITLSTTGVGDVAFGVTGAAPGSITYSGLSAMTSGCVGSGPWGGLGSDVLLFFPATTAPFAALVDAVGAYSYALRPGSVLPGLVFDVVNYSNTPNDGWQLSEVGRIAF